MTTPRADHFRPCFEGMVPATLCTCAPDGTPNVAYLSQVQFVDPEHVALSYQFFSRTRENILANPRATLLVIHPLTGQQVRLAVEYQCTETAGPLFEAMKAKIAAIASHTGMAGIFRLLGADIYRVLEIEVLPGEALTPPPEPRHRLSSLRSCAEALRLAGERAIACGDLEGLLQAFLADLDQHLGIKHAMILIRDAGGDRLFTVASHGYADSGVGSEIALGEGVIGVACREGVPIRIGHMTSEYAYTRALRQSAAQGGLADQLATEIPFPGLADARSQMAVPLACQGGTIGVVYVESPRDLAFTYDDEDALVTLAGQLSLAIRLIQAQAEPTEETAPAGPPPEPAAPTGKPLEVRYYPENDSLFLGGEYLIKGVAGSILWTLLLEHRDHGRTCFSNRELRVDPRVKLPDVSDNLEARLVLLHRRLEERKACIRIERTGRGRFALQVKCPLHLVIAG